MSENKKQSGYAILKAKIAKKDQEIEKLKTDIKQLKVDNANLSANYGIMENNFNTWRNRAQELSKQLATAIKQMGWLRRKIYNY